MQTEEKTISVPELVEILNGVTAETLIFAEKTVGIINTKELLILNGINILKQLVKGIENDRNKGD